MYVQDDHPDTQYYIAKHQQWDTHVICQCATIKRYTELIQHTEIIIYLYELVDKHMHTQTHTHTTQTHTNTHTHPHTHTRTHVYNHSIIITTLTLSCNDNDAP